MGMVVMSKRELNRLDVLARLDSDRLTARAAAELMAMTPRHPKPLYERELVKAFPHGAYQRSYPFV
jgi:hypothetical protein